MRVRATLLLLAVAASTALIASPAAAEEGSTLVLDPGHVLIAFRAVESQGGLVEVDAPHRGITPHAVPVRPGGTVTVALPPHVDFGEGVFARFSDIGGSGSTATGVTALGKAATGSLSRTAPTAPSRGCRST